MIWFFKITGEQGSLGIMHPVENGKGCAASFVSVCVPSRSIMSAGSIDYKLFLLSSDCSLMLDFDLVA